MLCSPRYRLLSLLVVVMLLGGCGRSTDSYFPLQKGWRWNYDLNVVTMDGPQRKKFIVENLGRVELDGQTLSARGTADGGLSYYRDDDGELVRIGETPAEAATVIYPSPRVVLLRTLDASASWTDTEYTVALEHTGPPEESLNRISVPVDLHYVVEAINDEVSVPAGHFTRCVRIKGVGGSSKNVGFYVGQTDIKI